MRFICLDVATAPLENAAAYLSDDIRAPSNWKDEAKIAAYVTEKKAERLASAALDLDLCRVTAVAVAYPFHLSGDVAQDETEERRILSSLALELSKVETIITYNGSRFDLPLLMRRARYLGLTFPKLNLDRYRSPHIDLCELLSDRDPQRRRSLSFYCKRLGWEDLAEKPLAGAEEVKVFETGRWDDLRASVKRDVEAVYRLARWLELAPHPSAVLVEEPVL